jgi:hypothetical protein
MGFFRGAARAYVLNRLLRGSRRQSRSAWHSGYGSSYARRSRHRRGSGFGMRGPFPSYSRRTRGGSRVTVTGCCLPIPLTLGVGAAVALSKTARRTPTRLGRR